MLSREQEIITICECLKTLWLHCPELRFGQVIENFIHKNSHMKDIFYQTDTDTQKYITEAIELYDDIFFVSNN